MPNQATREAAADVIERGMNLLIERGWCKRDLIDGAGRMCMAGALRTADGQTVYGGLDLPRVTLDLAWRYVAHEAGTSPALASFNDAPETTLEDVLLVMKRAAASLREVA